MQVTILSTPNVKWVYRRRGSNVGKGRTHSRDMRSGDIPTHDSWPLTAPTTGRETHHPSTARPTSPKSRVIFLAAIPLSLLSSPAVVSIKAHDISSAHIGSSAPLFEDLLEAGPGKCCYSSRGTSGSRIHSALWNMAGSLLYGQAHRALGWL